MKGIDQRANWDLKANAYKRCLRLMPWNEGMTDFEVTWAENPTPIMKRWVAVEAGRPGIHQGWLIHLSKCSLTGEVDNLPHTHPKPSDSDTGWTCFRVRLVDLILCPKPARTGLVVGPPYTTFTVFPHLRVYFPFPAFLSTILLSTFHLLLFP